METGEHSDAPNTDEPPAASNECIILDEDDSPSNRTTCNLSNGPDSRPDKILKNLQNISYIYRQDVVKSKNRGMIGIVTEVSGDSDSDSDITDDEDDDDEEEENEEVGSNGEGDEDGSRRSEGSVSGNTSGGSYKNEPPLSADQVRVLWMDESETTEGTDDVILLDRGFLHGDYVAAASDPTGQVGVVVDVNISVDLLTHDGSVIEGVSSRELKRVRDFTVGDYVVFGPWLGRIDDVVDNVTVMFDDGSMCKVTKADPLRLKPVGKSALEDGHFPYYPGQRVKASSSSVFKNSRWLSGLWKANRLEGTVTKVTVGSVFIYWIASAGYGPDSSTTPAEEQSPKNLKLLSCFAHANWQLGDWCLLPSHVSLSSVTAEKGLSKIGLQADTGSDILELAQAGAAFDLDVPPSEESNGNRECTEVNMDDSLDGHCENMENDNTPTESSSRARALAASKGPVQETWPLHRKKIRKVIVRREKKVQKKEENFERALLIVNTRTIVDIAWQDGTIERGLKSTSLIPIDNPGDHEFVAEQYVVEKASDDDNSAGEVRRVGVINSVNAQEKTACVKWLKPVNRAEDPREFDKEEVVSVYELEGHPDYDYCYGDVVVRLTPVSVPGQTDPLSNYSEDSKSLVFPSEIKQREKPPVYKKLDSDDASMEFSDLSWVGNITGLKNGDIEITWADGMISTVGPQAIYVVGRDDDESVAGESELSDDAASWETVEDEETETHGNAKEDLGSHSTAGSSSGTEESTAKAENSARNGALSIPLAALGCVTRLVSGIFARGRKQADSLSSDSNSEFQSQGLLVSRDPHDESSAQIVDGFDKSGKQKEKKDDHGTADALDLLEVAEALCNLNFKEPNGPTGCDEFSSSFRRFDITKDPYDHHFLGASGQNNAGRKWLKKVQQDWNILQNNLPDGIYVHVYEDRMDLVRAVMVGAYGTPYQDGLFVFDFHLPPEYPDVPPSAYYHSGGWRINPNLYEEGKVCLSLLNTWTGRGNEVWDPSSSSILQVLVSLQGLVLNSRPYFNEAGYDKQIGTAEGEKNSLSYNENTFLLNCKTMMYLMRKPPKDFEDLVREHFKKRGHYILKACDAYMKGYLIGSLTKDASIGCNVDTNSNSVGFKLMLAKIAPKLLTALIEVGADCQQFMHLQQL